jgi:hypothetical protein
MWLALLIADTLDHTRALRHRKAADGRQRAAAESPPSLLIEPSFSAILGPFYRAGVPVQENGTSIIRQDEGDAPYTHLFGVIHDAEGKPLPNAIVDIWHDAVSPDRRLCHETERRGRKRLIWPFRCGPAGRPVRLADATQARIPLQGPLQDRRQRLI